MPAPSGGMSPTVPSLPFSTIRSGSRQVPRANSDPMRVGASFSRPRPSGWWQASQRFGRLPDRRRIAAAPPASAAPPEPPTSRACRAIRSVRARRPRASEIATLCCQAPQARARGSASARGLAAPRPRPAVAAAAPRRQRRDRPPTETLTPRRDRATPGTRRTRRSGRSAVRDRDRARSGVDSTADSTPV